MTYVSGVILACFGMAIIIAMIHQAWIYWRGQSLVSRRQLILRICTGVLLLLTIVMIFYVTINPLHSARLALLYWSILTLLPLLSIILAWLDLRELVQMRHQQQAQLYRSLAELQQEIKRGKPEKGP